MSYNTKIKATLLIDILTNIDPYWRYTPKTYEEIFSKLYPSITVCSDVQGSNVQSWGYILKFINEDEYTHFCLTYL